MLITHIFIDTISSVHDDGDHTVLYEEGTGFVHTDIRKI